MIEEIFSHRSVRKYRPDPIPAGVLDEILEAGTKASNTGNMQLYSMVVTTDEALREALLPCHFGQRMVVEAQVVITFCADVNRFSLWCRQRGAEPVYDNFVWFVNALTDTVLASQNVALQAEAHGLGICYLGTTVYTADKIAEVLHLPQGVIPVTTLVVGYPADPFPPLTDRLPLQAVVHRETYHDYTPGAIDELWAAKEASAETAALLEANDLPNLARIFTERRYKGEDNIAFSRKYFDVLRAQGFFNQ